MDWYYWIAFVVLFCVAIWCFVDCRIVRASRKDVSRRLTRTDEVRDYLLKRERQLELTTARYEKAFRHIYWALGYNIEQHGVPKDENLSGSVDEMIAKYAGLVVESQKPPKKRS